MTQYIQYIIYHSHSDKWIGEMCLFWSLRVDMNWDPLFNKLYVRKRGRKGTVKGNTMKWFGR